MALGVLAIIFAALGLSVIVAQFLLYKNNSNWVFILNVALGIILSFLIFTSLPSDYTNQKYISLIWGGLAILAMILKSTNIKILTLSKIMLSVSLIGGVIHLMF